MRTLLAALLATACAPIEDEAALVEDTAAVFVAPLAGPPGPPVIKPTAAPLGGKQRIEILNVNPGERVYVARSANGIGAGGCPPVLGGTCFGVRDPVVLHADFKADNVGYANVEVSIKNTAAWNGQTWCLQPGVIRGGVAVLGTPVCVPVGYDTDGDLVLNGSDVCAAGDDFYDWDEDGTADACDRVQDRPPVYTLARYPVPLETWSFQSRKVRQIIPANPVGIVFAFHGSGGDSAFVDSPEMIYAFRELLDRGYGFVAVDSTNRTRGSWDDTSSVASNPDWSRVNALRTRLISDGDIDADTPVVLWGFSAGGGMAAWIGHAAPSRGWPVAALSLHQSGGSSGFGPSPLIPTAFLPAEWDTQVEPQRLIDRYNDVDALGVPAVLISQDEQRLAPTRFERSSFVRASKSLELFKQLVEDGYYGKDGRRNFNASQIESTLDTIGADPEYTPNAPAKSVLSSVLATHALIGEYIQEEADFFDAQL